LQANLLLRFGNYISRKPNFLLASVISFGIPVAITEAVLLSEAPPIIIGLAALGGLGCGYVWGLCMWNLMFREIFARRAEREQR